MNTITMSPDEAKTRLLPAHFAQYSWGKPLDNFIFSLS